MLVIEMRKTGYAYSAEKQKILIRQSLKVQIISILSIAVIVFIGFGYKSAVSCLFGGVCAIVPNLIFAFYCFKHKGAQSAKKIVASFYLAEVLKFVLVFTFLIISYTLANNILWLNHLGILVGFITTYGSVFFIPYVTK